MTGADRQEIMPGPLIKYSPDYTMVFGTNGKGQEIQSTPFMWGGGPGVPST